MVYTIQSSPAHKLLLNLAIPISNRKYFPPSRFVPIPFWGVMFHLDTLAETLFSWHHRFFCPIHYITTIPSQKMETTILKEYKSWKLRKWCDTERKKDKTFLSISVFSWNVIDDIYAWYIMKMSSRKHFYCCFIST